MIDKKFYFITLIFTSLITFSCYHSNKQISFYYWKTTLHLDSNEKTVLFGNDVKKIYTRYFDVDYLPGDTSPKTISPIIFDSSNYQFQIIPVIYIKNRSFERLDSISITHLAEKVYALVQQISYSIKSNTNEVQFDCDWTDSSRDKYFLFLKLYRALSSQTISATIRLHQVKYASRTGIPPVDYGVLMYYNMGEIGVGTTNSIYDNTIASKYILSLKAYPLPLDVALPIFSWSQQIREGKVIKLLNKMNFSHFENDSNFMLVQPNRFSVKHACFHGGYYFQENDVVKIEHVTENDLLEMAEAINNNSNDRIGNLIFYDLDKANFVLYEKDVFRKVVRRFD